MGRKFRPELGDSLRIQGKSEKANLDKYEDIVTIKQQDAVIRDLNRMLSQHQLENERLKLDIQAKSRENDSLAKQLEKSNGYAQAQDYQVEAAKAAKKANEEVILSLKQESADGRQRERALSARAERAEEQCSMLKDSLSKQQGVILELQAERERLQLASSESDRCAEHLNYKLLCQEGKLRVTEEENRKAHEHISIVESERDEMQRRAEQAQIHCEAQIPEMKRLQAEKQQLLQRLAAAESSNSRLQHLNMMNKDRRANLERQLQDSEFENSKKGRDLDKHAARVHELVMREVPGLIAEKGLLVPKEASAPRLEHQAFVGGAPSARPAPEVQRQKGRIKLSKTKALEKQEKGKREVAANELVLSEKNRKDHQSVSQYVSSYEDIEQRCLA